MAGKLRGVNGDGMRGPMALREWRVAQGLSRQMVASALGLKDSASIWQWETGRHPIPYARMVKLSEWSGIPIWTLAWPQQRMVIRGMHGADPYQRPEPAAQPEAAAE